MNNISSDERIANAVLVGVGGSDNVESVFNCATRLRFEIRDYSKVDENALKGISGVLGTNKAGHQFQVIIGPNVGKVYERLNSLGGLRTKPAIDENLDPEVQTDAARASRRVTPGSVFNHVLTYIMSSMAPIIPVLVGVSIWKTVGVLLGPDMLDLIAETSDFYVMSAFLFSALFYFLPVFVGYTAARALKVEPMWGMFLGTLIIVPTFVALADTTDGFSVFGIPVPVADYSQQFLPVLLGVWILKYVLTFVTRIVPDVIASLFVPIITVAVMTVVMFAVCAPLGSYVGRLFSTVFMFFSSTPTPIRAISMAVLAALIPLMVLFGMHVAIYVAALTAAAAVGYDAFFFPSMIMGSFALYGMSLGATISFRRERKGVATAALVSGVLGGITEPSLYGVALRSRKSIAVVLGASGVGGALAGVFGLKCTLLASVSVLSLVPFFSVAAAGPANIWIGVVAAFVSFFLAALGVIFISRDRGMELSEEA